MKARMKFIGCFGCAFLVLTFSVLGQNTPILINQGKKDLSVQEQRKKEFYSQFPTAQFDAPEDADPEKKAKRKLKNKRYDNRGGLVSSNLPIDDDGEMMLVTHSDLAIKGLPANESEIIVIGEISDAQAYLSNNKKGVYSEFTIHIKETLKHNSTNVTEGSIITADREGGFVQYKNGKRRLCWIGGTQMPRKGRQYVLFLKKDDASPNYEIITGYELKSDGVANLNGSDQFRIYFGMDEAVFMKAVRQAIAQSLSATP